MSPLKFAFPRWIIWLHDALALQNFPGSHQDDPTIQPERAMIDVPQIEKKSLLPVGGIPSIDLGPTRQAGRNEVATMLLRAISCEVLHEKGPRTHETHLAPQYVEEFRKFIQAGAAHQLAKSREPICIGQELSIGATGIGHCTKFVQQKRLPMQPGSFLYKKEGPAMHDPCHQCGESDNGKKEREEADRHREIEDALAWEESSNRCFRGIDDLAHDGSTRETEQLDVARAHGLGSF